MGHVTSTRCQFAVNVNLMVPVIGPLMQRTMKYYYSPITNVGSKLTGIMSFRVLFMSFSGSVAQTSVTCISTGNFSGLAGDPNLT